MPSLQYIDRRREEEPSPLRQAVGSFSKKLGEDYRQKQDTDELAAIYKQYQNDGDHINKTFEALQTNPNISPTRRVEATNTLLDFHKVNEDKQKVASAALKKSEADKAERERITSSNLELYNTFMTPEEAARQAPVDSEATARAKFTHSNKKKTQASQPIDEDQQKRIDSVYTNPAFESGTVPQKGKLLRDAGVSKENAKAIVDEYIEASKLDLDNERAKIINKNQAENDVTFYNDQVKKLPELIQRQTTLDAASELNEKGVTGNNWDIAMQKAGLVQYTSNGYREFASIAKDAVKNQNIKSVIGSQISQLEFGFFRDATINPAFNKEANRQIIKKEMLAVRYEKLYSDIAKNIVENNDGKIPLNFQAQVNAEYAIQASKISKELKQTAQDFNAIQNVPEGKVLMFDKRRRPLHVPKDKVVQAKKDGATLS